MAKYCVTGAAGFIGARVVEMLLDAGHQVTGVDNLNLAYDVRMKEFRLRSLQDRPGFVFHPLDICDRAALGQIFESQAFDAVFNLAARAGVRQSTENPWVYLETNVTGTLNLLELCHKYGISKFILASTSSVYGANPPMPTPEDADSDHPLSVYAASKKAAEALCFSYHHLYNIDMTIFRYFVVYGPSGRPDMSMFRFSQWITEGRPLRLYGDGEQTRDFISVRDVARANGEALTGTGVVGGRYNVCTGRAMSLNQALAIYQALFPGVPPAEHAAARLGDIRHSLGAPELSRQVLGFSAQVPFEQGLRELVMSC